MTTRLPGVPAPDGRVDLRSDTVTRPTPEMRRAMAAAEVGDDGFGDDPTVNMLEERFAELLGKAAAVFVPSGTMSNQIALRILARPGDSVLVGRRQHVVVREHGAAGPNGAVQLVALDDADGTLDPAEVAAWAADARVGWAAACGGVRGGQPRRGWRTSVAAATARGGCRGGPAVAPRRRPPVERRGGQRVGAGDPCCAGDHRHMLPLKGLGAPVGSLLAGPGDLMAAAREERKRLGGGMRQVGILAAAGLVALSRIDRLADDHARAARLAHAAAARWPGSIDPGTVETNIVRFAPPDPLAVLRHLASEGILAVPGSAIEVRLVTHADVDDADVERACSALAGAPS